MPITGDLGRDSGHESHKQIELPKNLPDCLQDLHPSLTQDTRTLSSQFRGKIVAKATRRSLMPAGQLC